MDDTPGDADAEIIVGQCGNVNAGFRDAGFRDDSGRRALFRVPATAP